MLYQNGTLFCYLVNISSYNYKNLYTHLFLDAKARAGLETALLGATAKEDGEERVGSLEVIRRYLQEGIYSHLGLPEFCSVH